MKKEVAIEWAKALRSGMYEQNTGSLQSDKEEGKESKNSYCCFGVLCQIAPKYVEVNRYPDNTLVGLSLNSQPGVEEWAGMKSSLGILKESPSLVTLNDTKVSFEEIATIIEKHWEEL